MTNESNRIVTPTAAHLCWHDAEVGMFYHFDLPVYTPGWRWQDWGEMPDPNLYQPDKLDTDQWMEAAKAIGAGYAVFVAKHCSGFCQWQTDIYPYGVKQSSWRNGKGDVVEDFIRSCEKYDVKPGIYASMCFNSYLGVLRGKVNRGEGGDPERQAEYVGICERMATELWSRYGNLFEVWFDGGLVPVEEGGPDLISILNRYQPEAIAFQGSVGMPNLIRWVGNERGIAPDPCWSTTDEGAFEDGTKERTFDGNPDGKLWIPGECDVPVRNHDWFWKPDREDRLYSVDELVNMYYCSVGRGCNLLLNANPDQSGLVPDADLEHYVAFGKEIRKRFSCPLASTNGTGTSIELDLDRPQEINHIMIMEDIAQGERILDYVVEGLVAPDVWRPLCAGQSIGHKRIQQFESIEVAKVRLRVTNAKDTPQVREMAVCFVSSCPQKR